MTEYHYTTYRIGNLVLPDDLKPGEVEVDPLTPEMQRKIVAKLQANIDRELVRAMTGGYDVETNSTGKKGVTIEHVRRSGALISDSRSRARESGTGLDQSRATERTSENPSEG